MKPAYVKWHGRWNDPQERRAELRAGERGKGAKLAAVNYWPRSTTSRREASSHFAAVARDAGYEIVGSDEGE